MNKEPPEQGTGQLASIERASILVVDDAAANLEVLTGMLKERGYKARPVPSGKLALLAAQKDPAGRKKDEEGVQGTWQIEPAAKIANTTMGLCIGEDLQTVLLRVSGNSGCNRFMQGRRAHAKGSSAAPPAAQPTRRTKCRCSSICLHGSEFELSKFDHSRK